MTEEIKYYKEKEYPLKWIPAEEMEETPQQTIERLERENRELKEKFNFMETANDIKKLDIDSLRNTNNKLRSVLEEIKNLVKEISYLGSRGERELKFKIKNILEDVIDEEIY